MEINDTVVALIVGLISLITSLSTAILTFRGGMPAASDDLASGFSKLHEEIRKELEDVRGELEEERKKRRRLEELLEEEKNEFLSFLKEMEKERKRIDQKFVSFNNGVRILILQLKENNIEPIWTPDDIIEE